jgi:DMSO/TMAO reductase YedYZ molybdopterin-dependent catalytic subunit
MASRLFLRLLFRAAAPFALALITLLTACAAPTTPATTTNTADYDLSYLINADPANIDNSGLPVTPLELMHIIGTPPEVDITSYRFKFSGQVDNPLDLSYDDLQNYPQEDRVVLLICPQTFADNPRWTGIPLVTLMAAAGAKAEATEIVMRSLDGFELSLPIELAPDILLAYEVDGATLPPGHGYPLRAVVKGRIGAFWLRWLSEIEIR